MYDQIHKAYDKYQASFFFCRKKKSTLYQLKEVIYYSYWK